MASTRGRNLGIYLTGDIVGRLEALRESGCALNVSRICQEAINRALDDAEQGLLAVRVVRHLEHT